MGYIYDRAKEAIRNFFGGDESKYKDVFAIRWTEQFHQPLRAARRFLNPGIFYDKPRLEFDEEVNRGIPIAYSNCFQNIKCKLR